MSIRAASSRPSALAFIGIKKLMRPGKRAFWIRFQLLDALEKPI